MDIPVIEYDGIEAADALLKFYAALGFDSKKHMLDPKKVKLSETDLIAFTEQLKTLCPDNAEGASLLMLNYGPSCDYAMKNGKVHLYDGWVEIG